MSESKTTDDWKPIASAPFGKILWIKNEVMDHPIKATRGYVSRGMVNPNLDLFTSVFTIISKYDAYPAGQLACPTVWKMCEEQDD